LKKSLNHSSMAASPCHYRWHAISDDLQRDTPTDSKGTTRTAHTRQKKYLSSNRASQDEIAHPRMPVMSTIPSARKPKDARIETSNGTRLDRPLTPARSHGVNSRSSLPMRSQLGAKGMWPPNRRHSLGSQSRDVAMLRDGLRIRSSAPQARLVRLADLGVARHPCPICGRTPSR
jgi:hypothetical protein